MPTPPRRLRAAVAGYGAYGRIHARKYQAHPEVELVAIADVDARRRQEARDEHPGVVVFADPAQLAGCADLASIAVPASAHHRLARTLLAGGLHLLIEKPFTTSLINARDLAAHAAAHRCVLQAGYLERFNATLAELRRRLPAPQYIEARRLTHWRGRGGDVNVVLDLMIHDIDMLLMLAASPVTHIEARGTRVFSSHWDVANAQLHFANGCVANLTASRAGPVNERRLHLFAEHACGLADIDAGTLLLHELDRRTQRVVTHIRAHREHDPLAAEIDAFVQAVLHRQTPRVGADDACRALAVAERIVAVMEQDADIATRIAMPLTDSQRAIDHLLRGAPHA